MEWAPDLIGRPVCVQDMSIYDGTDPVSSSGGGTRSRIRSRTYGIRNHSYIRSYIRIYGIRSISKVESTSNTYSYPYLFLRLVYDMLI